MTLRWRYYLAVVPLLLGLGLASAAVLLHLVRAETAWGMQQRAEGVAASVAEFLPVLEAADAERQRVLLRDTVGRLGMASIAVHRWPLDGGAPLLTYASDGHPLPPLPDPGRAAERLARDGIVWDREDNRIYGYALARAPDGSARALVTVSEHDTSLRDAVRALVSELVAVAVLLVLFGCLIAEWLTRMVQRELGALIRAAEALETGRSAEQGATGRIREINDLGGTLKTMASLLADGVQRIRLGFFEAETIPTPAAVARQVQRRQIERLRSMPTPPGVVWRALGEPPPGHVLGWRSVGADWVLCLGIVDDPGAQADPLAAALWAQAVAACALGATDADTLTTVRLFDEAALQRIDCSAGDITVRALGATASAAAPAPAGRQLYGTLGADAMQVARMYLAQTGDRPLAQVVAELEALLGARYVGFLWAVEGRSRH